MKPVNKWNKIGLFLLSVLFTAVWEVAEMGMGAYEGYVRGMPHMMEGFSADASPQRKLESIEWAFRFIVEIWSSIITEWLWVILAMVIYVFLEAFVILVMRTDWYKGMWLKTIVPRLPPPFEEFNPVFTIDTNTGKEWIIGTISGGVPVRCDPLRIMPYLYEMKRTLRTEPSLVMGRAEERVVSGHKLTAIADLDPALVRICVMCDDELVVETMGSRVQIERESYLLQSLHGYRTNRHSAWYILGRNGAVEVSSVAKVVLISKELDAIVMHLPAAAWSKAGVKAMKPLNVKGGMVQVQGADGANLYKSFGKIERVEGFKLIHSASTIPGFSGTPLIVDGCIVGMHVRKHRDGMYNVATSIIPLWDLLRKNESPIRGERGGYRRRLNLDDVESEGDFELYQGESDDERSDIEEYTVDKWEDGDFRGTKFKVKGASYYVEEMHDQNVRSMGGKSWGDYEESEEEEEWWENYERSYQTESGQKDKRCEGHWSSAIGQNLPCTYSVCPRFVKEAIYEVDLDFFYIGIYGPRIKGTPCQEQPEEYKQEHRQKRKTTDPKEPLRLYKGKLLKSFEGVATQIPISQFELRERPVGSSKVDVPNVEFRKADIPSTMRTCVAYMAEDLENTFKGGIPTIEEFLAFYGKWKDSGYRSLNTLKVEKPEITDEHKEAAYKLALYHWHRINLARKKSRENLAQVEAAGKQAADEAKSQEIEREEAEKKAQQEITKLKEDQQKLERKFADLMERLEGKQAQVQNLEKELQATKDALNVEKTKVKSLVEKEELRDINSGSTGLEESKATPPSVEDMRTELRLLKERQKESDFQIAQLKSLHAHMKGLDSGGPSRPSEALGKKKAKAAKAQMREKLGGRALVGDEAKLAKQLAREGLLDSWEPPKPQEKTSEEPKKPQSCEDSKSSSQA